MISIILVVVCSAVFSSLGQIFFKISSNKVRPAHSKSAKAYWKYIKDVLAIPLIWWGLGSMAVSLLIWFMAIAQSDLSLVYPLGSLYYIFILISARIFLNEKLDRMKILGTLFILAGILFIVKS